MQEHHLPTEGYMPLACEEAVTALEARVAALEGRAPRYGDAALASIAVGSQEVSVSWDSAMPSTTYRVVASVAAAVAVAGKLTAAVKAGSLTTTGCRLVVTNSGLVSVGGTVTAVAIPTAPAG